MDTTDSGSSGSTSTGCTPSKMLIDDQDDSNNLEVQQFTENATEASANPEFKIKRINRNIFLASHQRLPLVDSGSTSFRSHGPRERCQSPVSSIVSTSLNQMTLKRSSSAPMINQLGLVTPTPAETSRDRLTLNLSLVGKGTTSGTVGPSSTCSTPTNYGSNTNRDTSMMELDGTSFVSNFLAAFNNPRPRRFSASFSPGSPGPAPNRVSQLRRQENTSDWETNSEKEFHGAQNMAQSWEDLSLVSADEASMSMDLPLRRPSYTDPLFVSMPLGNSSASASASSSPAASPRVCNRFSPGLSSPSPTRKSFTSRRSLSPIATMRPSVLSIGLNNQQGLKRKSGWDDPMDCSPQPPAKRLGGLLTPGSPLLGNNFLHHNHCNSPTYPVHPLHQNHHLLLHGGSPGSLDTTGTESSVSSVSGLGDNGDSPSPFFRPVDSPSDISSADSPITK